MADFDYGRKKDLEELYKEREKAPYQHDRDFFDQAIGRIKRESSEIRNLRQDLLEQTASGDKDAQKKTIEKINKQRQDETGGREIS